MEPAYPQQLAALRHTEYSALKGGPPPPPCGQPPPEIRTQAMLTPSPDVTYLDHAGTTPYAKSLIQHFSDDLRANLFGNPHSASPSSELSTRRVHHVRSRVLDFFHADPEHFDVVFVANATAAIKLVVDAFRDVDAPGFWYGYHKDAHTSLVGVRQHAAQSRCFKSDREVEDWINRPDDGPSEGPGDNRTGHVGLFAYPAQSNMNGHRLPLDWPGRLRHSSQAAHRTVYTLLDAAAFVMTAQLDLSDAERAPDFTAFSFYKIFGFPDIGALIVRRAAGDMIRRRRYFGGGTVDMVTAMENPWFAKKEQTIHQQLEDGTLPFHQIIALDSALNVHATLYGSMANVSRHTCALAADLYNRMVQLRHANGRAVCEIYKDADSQYGNATTQGPTIAFNVRNAQGGWVGKSDVERLAIIRNIHLRTGGVCNPGGIATFCKLSYGELRRNFSEGMRCGDDYDILGGKPTGIVRVSLGAMSTSADVNKFIEFLTDLFVETEEVPAPTPCPLPRHDGQATVQQLRVFPVVGCSGWKVPQGVPWSVRENGLAWDREWCVVLQDDRIPLDPEVYPQLSAIKPVLDVKNGTLKLLAPKMTFEPRTEYLELTISLWDSPPSTSSSPFDTGYQPADSYTDEAIKTFFTAVLGVPTTLARFQDYRKVAKAHGRRDTVTSVPPSDEGSLTVAASTFGRTQANIAFAGVHIENNLRIGLHYFEACESRHHGLPAGVRRFRHLPNVYDRSPGAQNPTVQPGDPIQMFSPQNMMIDKGLSACIASTTVKGHICPVWNCRKDFGREEILAQHLLEHRNGTRQSKISDVQVIAFALQVTPSSPGLPHVVDPRVVAQKHHRRRSWRLSFGGVEKELIVDDGTERVGRADKDSSKRRSYSRNRSWRLPLLSVEPLPIPKAEVEKEVEVIKEDVIVDSPPRLKSRQMGSWRPSTFVFEPKHLELGNGAALEKEMMIRSKHSRRLSWRPSNLRATIKAVLAT